MKNPHFAGSPDMEWPCYKICFVYFTNWLNAGAFLPLVEPDWLKIGHMTRTISLD